MNVVSNLEPGALADVLEKARQLLAGGWSEPFSLDAAGTICLPDDEGIEKFCFDDALLVAAGHDSALAEAAQARIEFKGGFFGLADAERFVAGDFSRGKSRTEILSHWIADPNRTQRDVLQLIASAAARCRAESVHTYGLSGVTP